MNAIIGFALAGAAFGAVTFILFLAGSGRAETAGLGGILDRILGRDAFSLRFIAAALGLSLLSFLLVFATYLLKFPTFAESLTGDGFQRHAVVRQLLTMFVPMNAVITYLSLAYSREAAGRMERGEVVLPLLKDLAMKVGIVVIAMALVYLLLTSGGAFRSPGDALLAVPGVFWGAVRFLNLNCIYIYSSLVSSVWLWGWVLSGLAATEPGRRARAAATAGLSALFYWAAVLLT